MKKFVSAVILLCFFLTSGTGNYYTFAQSGPLKAGAISLPVPGTMVNLSPAYEPVLIKGLKVHPENPFLFDFIIDTGDDFRHPDAYNRHPERRRIDRHSQLFGEGSQQEQLKIESSKLIKYFLASLTIPEKDLWVNLSPYEKDRMIAPNLGQTQMGRDMLAEDYILKQMTASLIYPEKNLGKTFWDDVYAKARLLYGTTDIPVNTFNKVWIVADKADIFEHGNTAYVVSAHLKVMLEEDYLALSKHQRQPVNVNQGTWLQPCPRATASVGQYDQARCELLRVSGMRTQATQRLNVKAPQGNNPHALASQIIRRIILPQIEKEVNCGQNFAPLRQMFYSMVLASWYKMALKDAILTQIYANKSKVKVGINQDDPKANEAIFQRYLRAYKKGVFNYIKEDADQTGKQSIPRKYFSGGEDFAVLAQPEAVLHRHRPWSAGAVTGKIYIVSGIGVVGKVKTAQDAAMTAFGPDEFEEILYEHHLRLDTKDWVEEHLRKIYKAIEDWILDSTYGGDFRKVREYEAKYYDEWDESKKDDEGISTSRLWTVRHQMAVTVRAFELADALADTLKLSEDDVLKIVFAAAIHDVGKTKIEYPILNFPGRFSKEQKEAMDLHMKYGEQIMEELGIPDVIREIAGQHHEFINGKGYPKGLKAPYITWGGRILAVADVLSALREVRPYRESGLTIEQSLSIIRRGTGSQFDPQVVEALEKISSHLIEDSYVEHEVKDVDHFRHHPKEAKSDEAMSTKEIKGVKYVVFASHKANLEIMRRFIEFMRFNLTRWLYDPRPNHRKLYAVPVLMDNQETTLDFTESWNVVYRVLMDDLKQKWPSVRFMDYPVIVDNPDGPVRNVKFFAVRSEAERQDYTDYLNKKLDAIESDINQQQSDRQSIDQNTKVQGPITARKVIETIIEKNLDQPIDYSVQKEGPILNVALLLLTDDQYFQPELFESFQNDIKERLQLRMFGKWGALRFDSTGYRRIGTSGAFLRHLVVSSKGAYYAIKQKSEEKYLRELKKDVIKALEGIKRGLPPDPAVHSNPVGGIDFNRSNLQMNVRKEGTGVPMQFDPALVDRIRREGFDGLEFQIEKIIPVSNLYDEIMA